MRLTQVVIVERSAMLAEGLSSLLRASGRFNVVGCYGTLVEMLKSQRLSDVDVVVVAASLWAQVEECAELQEHTLVALQSSLVEGDALRSFSATINLYTPAEDVVRLINEAVENPTDRNVADSHDLSERERDVLVLVARGFTNKEIASELNISPHTVISHRKNIVHKTGIRSVAGLTVYAVLNKLIDSEML